MGYHVKILKSSVAAGVPGLTTVEARFPRKVLAEVVTHRLCRDSLGVTEVSLPERTATEDLSKNSASSRAIPVERMIQSVLDDPYIPERFSRAAKGMQSDGWLEGQAHEDAVRTWLMGRDMAVWHARVLLSLGAHKQEANRLLEPYAWITQIITADDRGWNNFFALRCHKDAEPAFQKIARMIYLARRRAPMDLLEPGDWHAPFVADLVHWPVTAVPGVTLDPMNVPPLIRASAARCAWVSYENHDRESTQGAVDRTYMRLCGASPVHASPLEHQAMYCGPAGVPECWRSNLRGWLQLRKLIRGERSDEYNPSDEEVASWGLGE